MNNEETKSTGLLSDPEKGQKIRKEALERVKKIRENIKEQKKKIGGAE